FPYPCCRLSYQRNDDDDEEAARERRRRARQERLRQKEEGDLSGEVTEKSEVNAQNSVAGEESKRSTDDEAALLERLARREERRQKRLQEALERQKELDPTITDGSLSLPSRREVNNVEENETTGKEEKAETRRGRYEIEETETVTKSYQRNNWRQDGEEEGKKEEKDKEEVQEEKPKELPIEENQVDVTAEKSTDKEEAVTVNAEEHKAENDTNAVPEGTQSVTDAVDKEKLRDEEKAEEERKEAEERERLKAEEEKRAAEERAKPEEEKRAAEERAKPEEEKRAAEERAKPEEEKRAAEERAKPEEEKRAAEERAKPEEEKRAAEERAKPEEEKRAAEEKQKAEEEKRAAEERAKAEEEKRAAEEKAKLEAEKLKEKQKMEAQKIEDKQVKEKKVEDQKPPAAVLKKQGEEKAEAKKEKLPEEKLQATSIKDQVKDDKGKAPKEEMRSVWDRKKGVPEQKAQNGERELPASKLKPTENAFGLEDQRRRRGENESEELEKLKEKQQEAAAELDELKKRREERRKILEEEEQKKKQEEAERKIREEEEKRRMKEEIERRRAEAAEKRQKMPEDGVSEDKKPFKCFSPKGSSLKIEERTEFLNKSAQKSGMKPTQTTAVVSKIDSRLEQYTSAIEGTKASRPAKASDLHVPAEGVRNIKSMWEKGNVFSSPSGTATPNKETAGLKVGVSSRINEWLTKTPESNKSPAPKPSDLRPGDVSGKRNLWEKQSVEKPAASSKVITLLG
ncbi:CALD1 protein, partial [Chloropsis cyanopogon]|nr:CALD1 protein [Chloropsis cyanopogon]